MNKYILIGIPGCGKSTLGQHVAKILKIPFYDTDRIAFKRLNLTRFEMMFFFDEERWFAEELIVLAELAELDSDALIAVSPEAALTEEYIEILKKMGRIIHINRDKDIVLGTLKSGGESNIVLRDIKHGLEIPVANTTMSAEAVELYSQQVWQYESLADYIFDNNESVEEGVDKLVALIESMNNSADMSCDKI